MMPWYGWTIIAILGSAGMGLILYALMTPDNAGVGAR